MKQPIWQQPEILKSLEHAGLAIGRLAEISRDEGRLERARRSLGLAEAIGGARARGQVADARDVLRHQSFSHKAHSAIWVASRIEVLARRIARRMTREIDSHELCEIYAASWRVAADPGALTIKGPRKAPPPSAALGDLLDEAAGDVVDVTTAEVQRLVLDSGPSPAAIAAPLAAWHARHCAASPAELAPTALLRIAVALADLIAIDPVSPALAQTARLALPLLLRREGLLPHPLLFFGNSLDGVTQRQIMRLLARPKGVEQVNTGREPDGTTELESVTLLLKAIAQAAERSVALISSIERIRAKWLVTLPNRRNLRLSFDCLFFEPLLSSALLIKTMAELGEKNLPLRSAQHQLAELEKVGAVREITGQSRYQLYLATSPALIGG